MSGTSTHGDAGMPIGRGLVDEGQTAVGRCRLVVIGAPSPDPWVCGPLAELLGLEALRPCSLEELDWDQLPERCLIQALGWPAERLLDRIRERQAVVLTIAMHPLDFLVAWLDHASSKHRDGRCPGGGACAECGIADASPASEKFLEYARGDSGKALVGQVAAWWEWPGVVRARYEEVQADPARVLGRLVEAIGERPLRSAEEVVVRQAIARLRIDRPHSEDARLHGGQERSGLWRHLIPAPTALAIQESHPEPFEVLEYACDPNASLTELQAELNWVRTHLDTARGHLVPAEERQLLADRAARAAQDALERALRDGHQRREAAGEAGAQPTSTAAAAPSPGGSKRLGGRGPVAGLARWLRPSIPGS